MVVVTYTAEGTRYTTEQVDHSDRADPQYASMRVSEPVDVRVEIELPHGHVNLDAYTTRTGPEYVAEDVQHKIAEHVDDRIEIDTGTLESSIDGNRDEWVRAARRWITERVEDGETDREQVRNALERFRGWDDTRLPEYVLKTLDEYDDLSPLYSDDDE